MAGRASGRRRDRSNERSEALSEVSELVAETVLVVQRRILETQLEILRDLAELTRRQLERLDERPSATPTRQTGPGRGTTAKNTVERVRVMDVPLDDSDDSLDGEEVAKARPAAPTRRKPVRLSTLANGRDGSRGDTGTS